MTITSIIRPFATKLPDIPVESGVGFNNDELMKMSMVGMTATLYEDTSTAPFTTISAPVLTYKRTAGPLPAPTQWFGPIIEVQSGKSLQVEWKNEIALAAIPVKETVELTDTSAPSIPQNQLGDGPNLQTPSKNAVLPLCVTHLHGANTAPNYDGWPESMIRSGQSRRVRYDNSERSTLLWYHDHAMHTTRLNVYAGLAGPYMIRDAVEAGLQSKFNLPSGRDEIPLVLRDCNLDLGGVAALTVGDNPTTLLHKTEDTVVEFFGPINMVNGAIWPERTVDPGLYRLRILNGANARTYGLCFATENADGSWTPILDGLPVHQIGSDGGLMDQPRDFAGEIISLMPAERLDLLVDFTAFAGQQIVLLNAVGAPFGGWANGEPTPKASYVESATPDTDATRNPYPQIMRFNVKAAATAGHPNSADLANILAALPNLAMQPDPSTTLPASPRTRTIGLMEKDMGNGVMLTTLEMVLEEDLRPYQPGATPYQALQAGRKVVFDGEAYRVCAERFQDPVNFEVKHGDTEIWRFINMSPDSHPMHIHLVQFKHTGTFELNLIQQKDEFGTLVRTEGDPDPQPNDQDKRVEAADTLNGAFTTGGYVEVTRNLAAPSPTLETGLKDTIRVDPGHMVEITAKFEGQYGRYLYHCHLLEHEDHDMMRQFIVTREDIDEIMPHRGKHPSGSIGI